MCYLRYPGRVLGSDEAPDAQLLGMVAAQLRVSPDVWDIYAQRDQRRREHLQEILERLGLNSSIVSRIERSRNGYCRPRCKRRKVSSSLKLPLRSFEDVALSCRRFW